MAAGTAFTCETCGFSIFARDDGDPYVIDADGSKRHVHPPGPERDRAVGIDVPHLCLGCGVEFAVGSRAPRVDCPARPCERIRATMDLAGARCLRCNAGTCEAGSFGAIS